MTTLKLLVFLIMLIAFIYLTKELIFHSKKIKTIIYISIYYTVIIILGVAGTPYAEETFVYNFFTIPYLIAFLVASIFNKEPKKNFIIFSISIIVASTISTTLIAMEYKENILKIPMLYFQFPFALIGGIIFFSISKVSIHFNNKSNKKNK